MYKKVNLLKKGVTLIELIIVIGIVGIVLLGAFLLFGFGNKSFANGTSQYNIQENVRLAADYTENQLRYCTDVEIIDQTAVPEQQSSLEPYQNYIYYKDGEIVHLNKYFEKSIYIGPSGNLDFNIFKKGDGTEDDKTLNIIINSKEKVQEYEISNNISILNITKGVDKKIVDSSSPTAVSPAVYFITLDDYIALNLMPIAKIGKDNGKYKFSIEFDRDIIGVEKNEEACININTEASSAQVLATNNNVIEVIPVLDESGKGKGGGKRYILTLTVTFGGDTSYENTYDYSFSLDEGVWIVYKN